MDRRTGNLDSAFWSKKRLSRLCTRCSPRFFIFFYFLFSIEFDRADDIIIGPDPVDPLPPPFPPPVLKPNQRFCRCGGGGGGGGGSFFGRANSRNWRPFCFVLFCFFALNDVDDGKLSFDFTDPIQISPDVKTKKKRDWRFTPAFVSPNSVDSFIFLFEKFDFHVQISSRFEWDVMKSTTWWTHFY